MLFSATQGDTHSVEEYLHKGVSVNVTNYDNRTALHLAAGAGNETLVPWLIENDADVNALARNQVTPLEEAVLRNRRSIVQLLRAKGGILHPDRLPVFSKLLIEASARGEVDYVSLLLDAGVDPNSTGYDDRTALHAASSEGRVGVVEVLVEGKADVQAVDRFGFTPLQECLRGQSRGHTACAKVLSELGATIPAKQVYNYLRYIGGVGFVGGCLWKQRSKVGIWRRAVARVCRTQFTTSVRKRRLFLRGAVSPRRPH